ncbi:uncharacterized protein H6S33_000668 [Morchella sextelata]|uniref:uncharacterized protein n=1 Tax=Morchella sextelata TaxID=1174677 RepID=UPI001D05490B|nr:uncharacterized protein H6S33_000668 [Morchella sextelata]KAH0615032.1 hypothetical protein H6S33_000668 [Morchella sextelata]
MSQAGIHSKISQVLGDVANLESSGLIAQAVDQEVLEKEITLKADQAIAGRENELDEKRLEKANNEKEKLVYSLGRVHEKLNHTRTKHSEKPELRVQIMELQEKTDALDHDIADIKARISARHSKVAGLLTAPILAAAERLPTETEREFLIRTGKITPFAQVPGAERSNLDIKRDVDGSLSNSMAKMSHQNLRRPGFQEDISLDYEESSEEEDEIPKKRRRLEIARVNATESEDFESISQNTSRKLKIREASSHSEDDYYSPGHPKKVKKHHRKRLDKDEDNFTVTGGVSEDRTDDDDDDDDDDDGDGDYIVEEEAATMKLRKRKAKSVEVDDLQKLDDGDEKYYQKRLKKWSVSRRTARNRENKSNGGTAKGLNPNPQLEEWYMPHPNKADAVFSGGFKIPGDIFPSLFDYQKIGVQWLWELHAQDAGGIIGDEMGLGKTIQIISFIAGLHHSNMLRKPVLIVAPATVLKQWANEFHLWWPPLRVSILHSSGSGMLNVKQEDSDELLEEEKSFSGRKSQVGARKIVSKVFDKGHVLITTYAGLKSYGDLLLNEEWEYAILDEGHKIRNPNAEISLSCKKLKTRHRIILSGTPLQNNLSELWSLFDFVFPGRLGTLPIFQNEFATPIKMGGYANASNVQVQTAYKCAVVLRELISPYLLRRLKVDVAADLPSKNEYEKFLESKQCAQILDGKLNSLFGIDILRKICNHPDLVDRATLMHAKDYEYGKGAYSGKMQITKSLLQLWKQQGHRTLLFAQTRQMLDILEHFVKSFQDFNYRRMDGNTAIQHRQELVDEFNRDTSIDVFLLTTKVGGLGVNLTGADRVVIFDPDWNPSTDMQARERAWRLGQKKSVTIYRLLTAGTIEEKIYHRQIYKQHLALKVLTDPNQKRFFKADDLHDLFKLGDSTVGTETGNMFRGAEKIYGEGISSDTTAAAPEENDDDPMELRKIAGVAALENFSNDASEENIANQDKTDEMRFMESIFGGSGVLSALEHDTVMNASNTQVNFAEKQATKVAEAAAKALRESIRTTQAASIGTVTWTGKFGSAGKEENKELPVIPTAAGLLATMRRRNNATSGGGTSSNSNSRSGSRNPSVKPIISSPRQYHQKEDGLITRLREYMRDNGGNATSVEISGFAKGVIEAGDKQRMDEFRHMLKEIAILKKQDRTWSLKKEFM